MNAEPKWQMVLYTRNESGVLVERGLVAGLLDLNAFDVTPETLPVVLARWWGPTVEQFAAMLRESGDLPEAQP